MYADDLLVLSPSPEGLQKSINVIKKHAEEWKLKVNTKKSNIIIFSGNGQTKNNENFQNGSETLPIVDKQTYLGIEMTSSGRYTYARDILSKKAYKVLATVKQVFSNSDTTTITIKNKLFDARQKFHTDDVDGLSVGWLVGWLVGWWVGGLVGWWVG